MENNSPILGSNIFNHLYEIRIRFFYIFLSFSFTFMVAYFFTEETIYFLAKPFLLKVESNNLTNSTLRNFIYTDLTEAFLTYIKISLFITIYTLIPLMIYQLWMFIVPGLFNYEKKILAGFCLLSFFSFLIGSCLAYYLIIPLACNFFLSFERSNDLSLYNIHIEAKINEYISTITKILLSFGFCFQLPVIIILLIKINLIPENWFLEKRNFSCVFIFILAALVSPPDLISQFLIVIPLLFIYEIAIFFVKLLKEYQLYKK